MKRGQNIFTLQARIGISAHTYIQNYIHLTVLERTRLQELNPPPQKKMPSFYFKIKDL